MAYPFSEIEIKWQEAWRSHEAFQTTRDDQNPKYYVLDMFAYPSGDGLHMGHPLSYTATDIVARAKRMQGFCVMHATGWDAFGLPAEQYAVKHKLHPRITTERNIANFHRQLDMLGYSYDWSREINTTDPNYFKWTQWIFLKFFNSYFDTRENKAKPISELVAIIEKNGTQGLPCSIPSRDVTHYSADEWKKATNKQRSDFLAHCRLAYVSDAPLNWCPELGTVLANEEVPEQIEKGYTVVRRNMRQWMLRITSYAERLLKDLDGLDWPESTVLQQRNWIGRSEGAEIDFPIAGHGGTLRVFTTRPDTLFGATYMVLAPEHPLVAEITSDSQRASVDAYIEQVRRKSDLERTDLAKEKTGTFTGAYAINPANQQHIPIWIADYVLMTYGTGAIMAVPGHDERDFEFAETFGLPIVRVVQAAGVSADEPLVKVFEDEGVAVNSGFLDGLPTQTAKAKMIDWLVEQKLGTRSVKFKLRDWLFSRQRYWGEPFPIIWVDEGDGAYPKALPEGSLPVILPEVQSYQPSGTGESPLATIDEWINTTDPETGLPARRETNTMPQWAGSSWYFLRYIDPANDTAPFSKEDEQYWMPIDLYIGGAEHAVTHWLYSRFWYKLLFDLGIVSTPEPFTKAFHQGMLLGENGSKMSKSLGNVINPDTLISEYGADTVRAYIMFLGPLEGTKPWDSKGINGVYRFLNRVWRIIVSDDNVTDLAKLSEAPPSRKVERLLHQTIRKLTDDIDALRFNTAISAMMILLNAIEEEENISREAYETLLRLLSPFAPHITEELWQRLGHPVMLAKESWPAYDESKAAEDSVTLILQVNGKLRDKLDVPRGLTREALEQFARESSKVKIHMDGKEIRKVIVVPDKLVNVVVA